MPVTTQTDRAPSSAFVCVDDELLEHHRIAGPTKRFVGFNDLWDRNAPIDTSPGRKRTSGCGRL